MSKVLVSYFSTSGNTKSVAEKLAAAINGDLFEIEPVDEYAPEDLDWMNSQSRASIEINENIRPEITKKIPNINEYKTICIGSPIWWDREPTIIDKFLEENDMTGKKIFVFVTSGSSGIDNAYSNLQKTFPNLNFVKGKRFSGIETEDEYISWIGR